VAISRPHQIAYVAEFKEFLQFGNLGSFEGLNNLLMYCFVKYKPHKDICTFNVLEFVDVLAFKNRESLDTNNSGAL